MSELPDIKVYAFLDPDPTDPRIEMEEESVSWIPGYLNEQTPEGLAPCLHPTNRELYEKIKELAVSHFALAFERMSPMFDDYFFQPIQISLDLKEIIHQTEFLAEFDEHKSMQYNGSYHFYASKYLIRSYGLELIKNKSVLPSLNIWEHELIHVLDAKQVLKASMFKTSIDPNNNLIYYILKYRLEGIASFLDLFDGKISMIKSIEEAKALFETNVENVKSILSQHVKTTGKIRQSIYFSTDFYTVGPWLVLDQIRSYIPDYKWNEITKMINDGADIEDEIKFDLLSSALNDSNENFLSHFRLFLFR